MCIEDLIQRRDDEWSTHCIRVDVLIDLSDGRPTYVHVLSYGGLDFSDELTRGLD